MKWLMSSGVSDKLFNMLKHFSAILLRVFLSRSTRTFPQHLITNKAWLGVHTPVFSIRLKIWIKKIRLSKNNAGSDLVELGPGDPPRPPNGQVEAVQHSVQNLGLLTCECGLLPAIFCLLRLNLDCKCVWFCLFDNITTIKLGNYRWRRVSWPKRSCSQRLLKLLRISRQRNWSQRWKMPLSLRCPRQPGEQTTNIPGGYAGHVARVCLLPSLNLWNKTYHKYR